MDDYLIEAIESACRDSYENLEVVIVFDGFRELPDLPDIAVRGHRLILRAVFPRSGAAAAINTGVECSSGAYIGRLDADDRTVVGRFTAQASILDNDASVGLVSSGADLIDCVGAVVGEFAHGNAGSRGALLRRNPFIHSSILFRRSLFDELGGYNTKLIRMQDYDFLLRAARLTQFVALDARLVQYRVHGGQMSFQRVHLVRTVSTILAGRMQLARSLGRSPVLCVPSTLVWGFAQYLRYVGVRRPLYLRGLSGVPFDAE